MILAELWYFADRGCLPFLLLARLLSMIIQLMTRLKDFTKFESPRNQEITEFK